MIITLIKIAHINSSSVPFPFQGQVIYLANLALLVQSVDICFIFLHTVPCKDGKPSVRCFNLKI